MTQNPTPDTSEPADAPAVAPRPGARLRQALSIASHRADPADPWGTTRPTSSIAPATVDDPFREPASSDVERRAVTTAPEEADDIPEPAPPSRQTVAAVPEPEPAPQAAAPRPAPQPAPATPVDDDPVHVVVDLRPNRGGLRGPVPARTGQDYGLGQRWGAEWRTATQGWIGKDTGRPVWRPVISTTEQLELWAVDTYLGVVESEVAVEATGGDFHQLGTTLARARELGMKGLIEEAIERGAHAVLGVNIQYTPLGDRLLMTITGTAVTLRERD